MYVRKEMHCSRSMLYQMNLDEFWLKLIWN